MIETGVLNVNSLIVPVFDDFQNQNNLEGTDKSSNSGLKKCFVVDPAACSTSHDENKITDYIVSNKMECVGIVLTHSHFDHILGIAAVKKVFPNAKIFIHENETNELGFTCGPMNNSILHFFRETGWIAEVEKQPSADVALHEGDDVFSWKVMHTPGHSPGSICLFNQSNQNEKILISGDTIFDFGGYGRTDMYGGDEAVLVQSIIRLKREIPKDTIVFPGHDSFGFTFG